MKTKNNELHFKDAVIYKDGCLYWVTPVGLTQKPGDRAGGREVNGYRRLSYKGIRALGGAKNLAKGASAVQSVARHSSPARNQVYDGAINTGTSAIKGTAKTLQKANQKTSIKPAY